LMFGLAFFGGGLDLRPGHRLAFIGVALLMYVFVATTAYVLWTPVGAKTFFGVQGRYFIPFIPVLFFAFARKRPNFGRAWVPYACAIFAICSLVIALRTVFLRYYG
jgi:uncharacterized membrane protein